MREEEFVTDRTPGAAALQPLDIAAQAACAAAAIFTQSLILVLVRRSMSVKLLTDRPPSLTYTTHQPHSTQSRAARTEANPGQWPVCPALSVVTRPLRLRRFHGSERASAQRNGTSTVRGFAKSLSHWCAIYCVLPKTTACAHQLLSCRGEGYHDYVDN